MNTEDLTFCDVCGKQTSELEWLVTLKHCPQCKEVAPDIDLARIEDLSSNQRYEYDSDDAYMQQDNYTSYVINASTDINEITKVIKEERTKGSYYFLQEWQQRLIDGGIFTTADSFCRFNDKNNIGLKLAKRFLRKSGTSLDIISHDIFGEDVATPQEIATFMLEIVNNPSICRKTSHEFVYLQMKRKRLLDEIKSARKKPKRVVIETKLVPDAVMQDLTIEQYSDSSYSVTGNTYPHRELLKSLGGVYIPYLKRNNERFKGWIFSLNNANRIFNLKTK